MHVATGNIYLPQDANGDGCYLADDRPQDSPNTPAQDDSALIACYNGSCTLTSDIPEGDKPLPPPEDTAPPPLVEPPAADEPTPAQSRSIVDGCGGLYQPCCPGAPLLSFSDARMQLRSVFLLHSLRGIVQAMTATDMSKYCDGSVLAQTK